ncbi:unnamed protein product [Staurois parvus]|uniref:Uncharacterized protein n=1 Tax=Staurois parvus TaxID=386267 RepID=A0ABN9EEM2_9NEOB|nr:unnamed protein product [Staurois parvus]
MCNVSVTDDIITIPQPALLEPVGSADLCQCCVLSVCGGWATCCHSVLSPPIAWGIPAWDLSECGSIILYSLQLSPCHCQPQIQSVRDTEFVFNIGAGGIL